jgi:hypothetical protein
VRSLASSGRIPLARLKTMAPKTNTTAMAKAAVARAFKRWHRTHRHAIPFPLQAQSGESRVTVTLVGIHPAINVYLDPKGLCISVNWDGENWDFLIWDDLVAVSNGIDWRCTECPNEGRDLRFASIEALWDDHLFDRLASWIRDELMPANYAALYKLEGRATWVKLSAEAPAAHESLKFSLALHEGRGDPASTTLHQPKKEPLC